MSYNDYYRSWDSPALLKTGLGQPLAPHVQRAVNDALMGREYLTDGQRAQAREPLSPDVRAAIHADTYRYGGW